MALCEIVEFEPDMEYGNTAFFTCRKINYPAGKALSLNKIGAIYFIKGKYKRSNFILRWAGRNRNNLQGVAARFRSNIASVYHCQKNFDKALKYSLEALKLIKRPLELRHHILISGIFYLMLKIFKISSVLPGCF